MVTRLSYVLLVVGLIIGGGVGYGVTYASYAPQLDATRQDLSNAQSDLSNVNSALAKATSEAQNLKAELGKSIGDRFLITQGDLILQEGVPPMPGMPKTKLPQTLNEAQAQGWVALGEPGQPPGCVPNMGIHAARIVGGMPDTSLLLLFNTKGELIGIELETMTEQASPPWEHLPMGHPGMEFEHWTLHMYTKDPSTACS